MRQELNLALALLAAAVACLAHVPALAGGYVLDDGVLLVNNPFLRDVNGLLELLRSEFFAASAEPRSAPYYRPVSGALYWLSHQVLGSKPIGQHALNLVLHAGVVTWLTLIVLQATQQRRAVASVLVVCASVAAHPASPEIVAYVGGRQELLGWNLVLSGFWLALRFSLRGVTLAAVVFFVCTAAALTREFFFASPLLLLPLASTSNGQRARRALTIVGAGALGLLLVFGLRRAVGVAGFDIPLELGSLTAIAAGIALRVARVVVWPTDVSVEVTPPLVSLPASVLTLLALAGLTAWTLHRVWKRDSLLLLVSLGWVCLWCTIVLHVPVVKAFQVFSDRYVYAALIGVAVMLNVGVQLLPSLARRRRWLALASGGLVVLVLIPSSWARAAEWRNERTLQAAMFERRPTDPHSQLAEGLRLFAEREYESAWQHCLAYHQAFPTSDRAGLCLGTLLLMRGKASEAAVHLEPYAFARPSSLRARVTLFRAWFEANDLAAVERGLAYYGPLFSTAPDLDAARTELQRRLL